jgi:stringent starvation protein B
VTRKGIHHPIQAAVEDIYGAGHTPRLQIDARRNDVEVPESVRRTWGARLVIDLDPSYPLDLAYDADGVSVDLAFQGIVSRCRFGWRAVYAVIDRATGRGIVVEAHLPPPDLDAELVWVERQKKPRLSAVPSARPLVRASKPASERSGAEGTPKPMSAVSPASPSPVPGSDEVAKERRARFRVIDGGR